ncbi:MAG: hypothetical protein GX760_03065 [Erysipelothrix sp.]|nr:hypothetical protein [Erysipelothrix sp.]
MIDLRISSILGDGDMSVFRLIETLKENPLKYFSIVDLNHALAYRIIEKEGLDNLITGASFKVSYKDEIIHILGYDIDTEALNVLYEEKFPIEVIEKGERAISNFLIKVFQEDGYTIDDSDFRFDKIGVAIEQVYAAVMYMNPQFEYRTLRDFKNHGINNQSSKYYYNTVETCFSVNEAVALIHSLNGKAFLACPFEYRRDVAGLLEMVIEHNLDGVEVFHASSSQVNSMKLIEFCIMNKKLASIGSGFKGSDQLIPWGVYVDEQILELKCFDWIMKRGEKND